MKRIKLLTGLLLLQLTTFCQQDMLPGYVVTTSGDTLKGLVGYAPGPEIPRVINFSGVDHQLKPIPATDIRSFGIDGKGHFEKFVVSVSTRPLDTLALRNFTNAGSRTDTFFLKRLATGEISLYALYDFKDHFFIRNGSGPISELGYGYEADEYNTQFFENSAYRKQLLQSIAGTKAESPLRDRIAKLAYKEDDLTGFIKLADSINSGIVDARKYEKPIKVSHFAGLGLAYNHMSASGAGDASISSVDYIGKLRPGVQVGFDFSSTRKLQDMIIRLELGYYKYLQMGDGEVEASPTERPRKTRYQVLLISMKPSLNVLYKVYNQPGFGVYLGAGYVLNFNVKSRNRMRHDYLDDGSADLWEPYRSFKGIWGQGVARAGVFIGKKFEVGLNLPFMGSFLKVDGLKVNPGNNSLLVNYRF